jgi:hypothetical protein
LLDYDSLGPVQRYAGTLTGMELAIKAYSGIPGLFFTWALRDDKRVHFEFLDNSVPEGHRPKTIAFGTNGVMNNLDLSCLLDIDRYQKININAKQRSEIYAHMPDKDEDCGADFVRKCVRQIPRVNFSNQETGQIYARMVAGKLEYSDARLCDRAFSGKRSRTAIKTIIGTQEEVLHFPGEEGGRLDPRHNMTLGEWGESRTL